MGTRMGLPYANLFMSKEERTIILTFLHLIYFWKRFVDDIFFNFLGIHCQLKSLMTFINTSSPTIKHMFTYSEQTVYFLDVQIYLSESKKPKKKLTAWHYFISTLTIHSAVKKVSFIPKHFDTTWSSQNIQKILQEKLKNLTRILLALKYPLHLIIKNIKKALAHNRNYLLSQRTPQTDTNICPILTSFLDIETYWQTVHGNYT